MSSVQAPRASSPTQVRPSRLRRPADAPSTPARNVSNSASCSLLPGPRAPPLVRSITTNRCALRAPYARKRPCARRRCGGRAVVDSAARAVNVDGSSKPGSVGGLVEFLGVVHETNEILGVLACTCIPAFQRGAAQSGFSLRAVWQTQPERRAVRVTIKLADAALRL